MTRRNTVVVLLPAYNEAAAIRNVLSKLPTHVAELTVLKLVVDDGSTDKTAAVAKDAGATVVSHVINLGVGAATRTGLRASQTLGADVVVTMDADGQHDPLDVERLARAVLDGPCDVAIGNRLIRPKGMPFSRVAANWLLDVITLVSYGGSVSDSQSGFKALSRKAIEVMDLKADGYEICSEMIGEVFAKKLTCKSVPVRPVYTNYSRAKGQHFLNGVNIILQLLTRMMRRV